MIRRRIGFVLLLAGSGALVWCLTVLAGGAVFNWYQSRRLDQAIRQGATAPMTSSPPLSAPKPNAVIGRLDIPRLHVSTVVMEGDDDAVLRFGAGHVRWTALPGQPGNIGIAAHRDTFFRPLRHIQPSDSLTLTTPHAIYHYRVESTEIVNPDDVGVLGASPTPELTLVTCYPFYYVGSAPKRFIVHARQIG